MAENLTRLISGPILIELPVINEFGDHPDQYWDQWVVEFEREMLWLWNERRAHDECVPHVPRGKVWGGF